MTAPRLRILASLLFFGIPVSPVAAHGEEGVQYDIDFHPPMVTHCYLHSGSSGDFFSRGTRLRVRLPHADDETVRNAMRCAFSNKSLVNEPHTYFQAVSRCAASHGLVLDPALMSMVPPDAQPQCPTK